MAFDCYDCFVGACVFSEEERRLLLVRSSITPPAVASAQSRVKIDQQMRSSLREFDQNNKGKLTFQEFHKLLADTSLALSSTVHHR